MQADWLGQGLNQELNRVGYELVAPAGTTASLDLCDTLGSPPVAISVITGGGPVDPVLVSGTIEVLEPTFRRGDCNRDDAVALADAIFLAVALFAGGGPITCEDACDTDDDGSLSLVDVIYLLAYLFQGGPAPPAPHPECGVDPTTGDGFGCDDPIPCP